MTSAKASSLSLWAFALCAALYGLLFFYVDRTVALFVQDAWLGTPVETAGRAVSALANGEHIHLMISAGLVVCWGHVLVRRRAGPSPWALALLYVCITVAVAIIVADGLKYGLGRYRPVEFFQHGHYGFAFLQTTWAENSTPSGHTVRAFALMTSLALLAPKAGWFFLAVAFAVGASRVVVADHYPSDVLFGAFIGVMTALWLHGLYRQLSACGQDRSAALRDAR